MSTASEFGRGKTIFVLAIVIGCFAVLWPKIFYPMLTASISQTQGDNGHMRPERPFRPGPDMVHPALRERGRAIPTVNIPRRTIEREARPGPVPGMRPPVGGAGHIPSAPKGGGTMGIIMPMYTIGIVCFFLYTIMKILFKKNPAEPEPPVKPAPIVKDYGLDPEHRKFVMSEEYAEGSDRSMKEAFSKEDRDLGLRRRPSGGKSAARFYEDRRRLEEPTVIFPTYPSDLETDPETTTPSLTPPTDMPESSTPAAQPDDDDVVNDDINITMPPVSPTLLQEIADTHIQIQSVTNEPESEPEALKDQMVYEKLEDEGSVPYSSLAHLEGDDDEGSIIPTLHDIVHEIVSEAEMIAERIKENAVFPVALEGDTMATSSADDASETTQNEPAILVEEEPKTTPSFVSTEIDDEVVKPESSKRHELSKEVSVCSSADTVVAESATGSETDDVDTAAIEAVVSSLSTAGDSEVAPKESVGDAGEIQKAEVGETEMVAESKPESEPAIKDQVVEEPVITSTKIVEQSAPPPAQPSEPGPLSPLAPEQTPDTESEPPHFFDRTIVIPDYEPEAARARKQSQELAREAVAPPLPSAPTEPEAEEPETITIVKQEAVPPEVLTLAEKVSERILEAAKAQFVNIAPKGESMLDELADDNDTAAAAITIEPTPESEPEPIISPQPRLSLDTNLPLPSTNKLEADADDVANPELLLPSDNLDFDTTTKTSSTPKAPATTPEIQVETPHADQTEINRIAEFLEGLNTEPKEAEKLAAVPQEQPEINQNAPIVTLADESKDSFSDSPKASQTPKTKSKLEITPVDDSQVAASSSFGIADICYVTQPLDDSQKGIDKSKIFKSSVEIVSFDESLTVATEPVEKFRKSSEPVNIGLDSKPTETLEEAVKKLRRVVPKDLSELGEGTGPDGEKLKKASRKSSTAQSEDSQKESEIDKYVEKLANMQGSRKSMIEQAMFKSSTSSQGSEPEQQQHADQSSNFHGPGLLDSGQSRELPGEKIDKMKEVEKWATATINDDDSGEKTTDVVDIINDASPTKLDEPIASNEPEPGTDIISVEIVAAPQEIIDKVASLIDQALHDGIKKAVKFLENSGTPTTIPVVESDSSLETVELGIEKLDQVLEELAAEAANNIILSSVPTMELKVEKDETGLLEPMEMEERPDSKAVCDKATILVRDTNETVQTDNETLSHAQPIISTTRDNTNNVDSITLKVETGIVSDSAEKVTSLTGVTNVRIAEEPETISTTATAVEASAFESTTTTIIPSESSPSETAPVAVESSETVTSLPKEEIVEEAVENAEEQAVENVEEISEQQDEGEESQEPIIAELETIQEEIESLSSELDQMENAALAASATSAEKVIEEGQEKEPTEQEPQKEKVELSEQQVQSETQVQAAEPPQVEEVLKTEVTLPVAAEAVEQNDGITIADTNQSEIQETSGSQQPAQAEESRISQETTNVNEFVNTQVDDLEKPKEISQIDESPNADVKEAIKLELSPVADESPKPMETTAAPEVLKSVELSKVQEALPVDQKIEAIEAPKAEEEPQVTAVVVPKAEEVSQVTAVVVPKAEEESQVTAVVEQTSLIKEEQSQHIADISDAETLPSTAETPITQEEACIPEKVPQVSEAPKQEETQQVTETPKPEETLQPEEVTQVSEPLKQEEVPQAAEAPKPEDVSQGLETPKPGEVGEVSEQPKQEEVTQISETPKQEETQPVPETPKPEEVAQVPETPKTEEVTQVSEPPKQEEIPQVAETPKPEEVPQVSETPKTEEVAQVLEPPKTEEPLCVITPMSEEVQSVSDLGEAEETKPAVTEISTVAAQVEEQLQRAEITTDQQQSEVEELPQNAEELKASQPPQIDEAPKPPQESIQVAESKSVTTFADEQKLAEQPSVVEIPVKSEEIGSVVASSQPLPSSETPEEVTIIPSEQQPLQMQPQEELQTISLSPIEIPTNAVMQPQPEAAPETDAQTETISEPKPLPEVPQTDTVQQQQEIQAVSVSDEPKPPEVVETVSANAVEPSPVLPAASPTQTDTLPPVVSLRFETLSEPPFPIPSSTPQNQYISDTTKVVGSDTITASCGVVESSSLSSASQQGAVLALTVETLDENSPEIFPLPSTQSMSVTPTTTSPVEKVQDQDVYQSPSVVVVGVPLTDADASADQRATQASSAPAATTTTSFAIDTVDQSPSISSSADQVSSGEIVDDEVPTSPAPPPTPAAHTLNEPPSFPVLGAEVSKQLSLEAEVTQQVQVPPVQAAPPVEEVVVVVQEAQPQQVELKDGGQKANRESGHRERDAIVTAVKGIVEAFDAPIVPALSSPFVAPSRSSSTKGTQEAASESSQTKPPLQPQLVEEDLEKLISGGDAEGTRKEDLASTPEKQEAQPLKPATKERKSSEKEVKFKLPPEELEDDEEDLEEEVEIVRPPTPPKTLSKSKPKSPEPTPEPTVNVPTSSSHRDHDELLISSMQTTVTGTGAPGITADNKSCSAGPDTTTTYNIASNVTTPNTISPTPPPPPQKLDNKSQSENIVEQSAAAAIAAAKAAGSSSPSPSERVSVIGIEETASLISGERWDNRTPTPTFRQQTPPVPHRPPTPPEKIPSIYLEGPMTVKGQEIIVREAQIEVEGGEDYDLDDEYEPSAPVVLSGKVTLSVISSAAGGPLSPDEVTDAPSLSLDDRAQAENSRGSSRRNLAAAISSAMNEEVKGKTDGKKSSNASSPDMDEYEVIGKGGFECEEDEAVDVSLDDYLTATDAELDAEKAHEDTAADISTIDDLKQDPLPQDEE